MRKFNLTKILSGVPSEKEDITLCLEKPFVAVEIGAGTGLHAINYATDFPERYIIAIEKTKTRFKKFKNDFLDSSLNNIKPVHGHAVSWLARNLTKSSVDEFILMYPNPNPKKKDLNKRWYAMPFFGFLLSCLKPEGRVLLRTNEQFYADEAMDYFQNTWNLRSSKTEIFNSPDLIPKTLFEKKYLERGETCYEVIGELT